MTALNQLLEVREEIINSYKKYERFIMPILKFILTVSVLMMITSSIGFSKPLSKMTIVLIMGLIGVFLPPQLIMLFFIIFTSLHAAAASLEVGIIIFIIMLIIYLLFIRLYPVEALLIIGTIIAYKLHIPYIIPLIGGLFGSLATMVALVIGVAIWYCAPQVILMMESQGAEMSEIAGIINSKLMALQEIFKTDQTLLASIIILSVVLLTVYLVRKQNIDCAEYIAILVGSVMNLIGFLFAIILLKVEVGIAGLMLSTIICAMIAAVAQFFSKVADYSRAELVQFEDEKNYYYVKVVPKIVINKSNMQIQHNYTRSNIQRKNHGN